VSISPATEEAFKPRAEAKALYGLGAAGEAVFGTAVGFIFFYYTAALGLPGSLVGAALFFGLCADAIVDPFFGSWSDNMRSRLGRRVPLMLVGGPLLAISMALLFMPPAGLGDVGTAVWLGVWSVAVRTFVSMFHVPYVALGAEMSRDYHERSSVVAWRTVFGILAGAATTAVAYTVFFSGPGGLQQADRYPGFGWTVAIMILIGCGVSAVGVTRFAASLPAPEPVGRALLARLPGEVIEIFKNPSFRLLFLAALLSYTAIGVNQAYNSHAYVFVWRLRPETIQFVAYSLLAGVLVGAGLAPRLSQYFEKKTIVIMGMALVVQVWLLMSLPRWAGLITATGDAALPYLCSLVAFAGIGAGFCAIAYPSMMADAADEHEHLFGRRREGLYFAGLGFAFKGANGVGVLVAGFTLDLIGFPKDAGRQVGVSLPEDLLERVLLMWTPVPAIFTVAAILVFTGYAISKTRHAEIARSLERRPEAQPAE
jgi:glycoside/pentoside/hexuronide:cation symporter, GPH family